MSPSLRARRMDWRLAAGIGLIVVAVLGVIGIVRITTAGHPVVIARGLLVEGQLVSATDLAVETLSGDLHENYATALDQIVGKVVTRAIRPGEFVPRASIGESSETLETSLVVDLATALPPSLHEGSVIDLWATSSQTGSSVAVTQPHEPRLVVSRARLVGRLATSPSALASQERVEIVVSRINIPDVLSCIAAGDVITVVAANGGALS